MEGLFEPKPLSAPGTLSRSKTTKCLLSPLGHLKLHSFQWTKYTSNAIRNCVTKFGSAITLLSELYLRKTLRTPKNTMFLRPGIHKCWWSRAHLASLERAFQYSCFGVSFVLICWVQLVSEAIKGSFICKPIMLDGNNTIFLNLSDFHTAIQTTPWKDFLSQSHLVLQAP